MYNQGQQTILYHIKKCKSLLNININKAQACLEIARESAMLLHWQ